LLSWKQYQNKKFNDFLGQKKVPIEPVLAAWWGGQVDDCEKTYRGNILLSSNKGV
jgi:hypothetical protein